MSRWRHSRARALGGAPAIAREGRKYAGDQHVLVLDRHACMLYETFNTVRCNGAWSALGDDLGFAELRTAPLGMDLGRRGRPPHLSGPGPLRRSGFRRNRYAIRFTLPHTKNDANGGYFVEPASHAAGPTA